MRRLAQVVKLKGALKQSMKGMTGLALDTSALVERISKQIGSAMHSPEVGKRLRADGTEPVGSLPSEFIAHIRAEAERWGRVITQAGIRGEQGGLLMRRGRPWRRTRGG